MLCFQNLYIQRYDVKCQTHIYVFTENDNLQIRKAFVMIYEVQKDRNIINFFKVKFGANDVGLLFCFALFANIYPPFT